MDNEMDYDTGASYESPSAADARFDWDSFIASAIGDLAPNQQQVANDLGAAEIAGYFGGSDGRVIGSVAGGASPDAKKEPSMISKFWGSLSGDDKKIGLSVLGMLGGGLANVGKGKREDRALQISQQNADANTAGVAERARQFNTQMANASSIGQTNFGTATQPLGMINAPVTLTRNRLKPTPGMPA